MPTLRTTLKRFTRWALACVAVLGGTSACWPDSDQVEGSCALVDRSVLGCRVPGYTEDLQPAGLVAYSCSGSARPDYDAVLHDGVPEGLLCADEGPLESGEEGYCCTEEAVPCALNTAEECEAGHTGYQCWGNNRPESLNPAVRCTNGTQERGLYHYCCTGKPEPSPCRESAAVGCSQRLLGFLCEGDTLPQGENYGANRSRADYYYPMCTTAMEAPNPAFNSYCCYMYLPVPQGGTCVPHPRVPGCEPGRFGFSCYGPDHPEDDFTSIDCPDPGVSGTSHEGYDATLYCCDFI
jgi:hypothetical protein